MVLATSNVNEVVFQKGLHYHLKTHPGELKFKLRQEVPTEAIREEAIFEFEQVDPRPTTRAAPASGCDMECANHVARTA